MDRRRRFSRCGWALACVAVLALPGAADAEKKADASGEAGDLRITVGHIESDKGQIGCSLFAAEEGFPSDAKKAIQSTFVKPKARKATCLFTNVKPGTYAVSVMHDLDGNGELEQSMIGRPKEPWGVSNNAPAERFGPPKFKAASFKYAGKATTMAIELHE